MHWQSRLPTIQKHFQMRTLARLKNSALLLKPPLHLLGVNAGNAKHFCCIRGLLTNSRFASISTTGMLFEAQTKLRKSTAHGFAWAGWRTLQTAMRITNSNFQRQGDRG